MKTIIVDDDLMGTEIFEQEFGQLLDIDIVGRFENGEDALHFAQSNPVEFALMDIMLPGMSGIDLGYELKKLNPDMIIIYLTGYSRYVVDTMRMKADYCIMKPYDIRDIRDAAMRVKLLSKRFQKRMQIVTCGRFEVFVDGKPVHFGNNKARELFALCVDREGAAVSMEEAIDVLWPERIYDDRVKRLYRKSVGAILSALEAVGERAVFVSNRGSCYLVRDKVECDLYHILDEGQLSARQRDILLNQGYMMDYSWAETRNSRFFSMLYQNDEEKRPELSL